ncbi:hotdog domain-containing protein [Pediococcus siamensis]|uniref:hotdog domain-containing protein n=1 Tax=Pediococcus siamensis TaxID=381829 RepID=UPI00399FE449
MQTSETCSEAQFKVTTADLNDLGILFGGKTLAELDRHLADAVRKITAHRFVTGSVDKVRFLRPGQLNEMLTVTAFVSGTQERVAEVFGRVYNAKHELLAYAFFTYVLLNKQARFPAVVAVSDFEKALATNFKQRQQTSLTSHLAVQNWLAKEKQA